MQNQRDAQVGRRNLPKQIRTFAGINLAMNFSELEGWERR
jgi:hypothetical protein